MHLQRRTEGEPGKECHGRIRIRIPGHVSGWRILRCGQQAEVKTEKGYALVDGPFTENETITVEFDMPPHFLFANPQVRADAGRTALVKGPLVYCLEETDNGDNLEQLLADSTGPVEEVFDPDNLGGTLKLIARIQNTA